MTMENPIRSAIQGVLWMALGCFLLAIVAGLVRHLSSDFNSTQLVFFRVSIGLLLFLPWLALKGVGQIGTRRISMHGLRTLFTYLAQLTVFYAVAHAQITEVFALQLSMPLFSVMLAVLCLGQRATVHTWLSCLVGLIGALVVLRPGAIELSLAALAALAAAFFYACSNTTAKILTRTETAGVMTFYTNLLILPFALVPVLFVWSTPEWHHVPWLIALAILNTLSQYCISRAIGAADARIVQPFNFLRIPFAALIGFVFFSELPNIWTWIGGSLVFLGSFYVLVQEASRRGKSSAASN